jgi:curved DNA-binding protein CbpA
MKLKRCFEILELDRGASIDEARQAYKDIVNVWHPDRFSHNPRLKQKAEKKLKEVNLAYETLKTSLSSKLAEDLLHKKAPRPKADAGYREAQSEAITKDRTEAVAEAGTRIVLSLWSYFSTKLRQMVDNQVLETETNDTTKSKRPR